MSVDLTNKRFKTYSDFSGGVNQRSSSFQLKDNELVDSTNMVLHDQGAIRVRKGWENYLVSPINAVIGNRSSHRYRDKDGNKSVIVYSGALNGSVQTTGILIEDDDAGVFTEIGSVQSNDDRLEMVQYRDTMIFCTTRSDHTAHTYHSSDSSVQSHGDFVKYLLDVLSVSATPANQTPYLGEGDYSYYITLDIFSGDEDLLVETPPFGFYEAGALSLKTQAVFSGSVIAGENVEFKKGSYEPDFSSMGAKNINIYRSLKLEEVLPVAYHIGAIKTSDWDAAAVGDALFLDTGDTQPGRILRHDIMNDPITGEHGVFFQGRLWLGNIEYYTVPWSLTSRSKETRPSSIAFSNFSTRGPEPLSYSVQNVLDIDVRDGYEITAMAAVNAQVLGIWKENSLYALVVGGGLADENTPIVNVRKVSENIGCIAPDSLVEIEGMYVFLSNWGVYAYDGNRLFDLKKRYIETDIENIPASLRDRATAVYDPLHKEYHLSYATPTSNGFNRRTATFNFENKSWSFADREYGISSYFKKQDAGEHPAIYACISDVPSLVALNGDAVVKMNESFNDILTTTSPPGTDITWSFQTKFYDMGLPFADKAFTHVLLQLKSNKDFTIDVVIDNRLDTRDDATEFDVPTPVPTGTLIWGTGQWGTGTWGGSTEGSQLVALDDRCWGKRISLVLSGAGTTASAEIQSITFFYDMKEGVRF